MIETLSFELFKNKLLSGITLKNESQELPYGFSINKGDLYSNSEVKSMRIGLAKTLGIDYTNMVFISQTHSDIVEIFDKERDSYFADAIITNQAGVCLNVSVADCIGLILYDSTNKVLAAIHSGWKGTQQNIAKNAVEKMSQVFGSNPRNINAIISPSASGEVYEVGKEVADYFPNSIKQISESKYLFDNKNQVKLQLIEAGVNIDKIIIQKECSITDLRFHSFRRDKDKSGRMSVFAMMK